MSQLFDSPKDDGGASRALRMLAGLLLAIEAIALLRLAWERYRWIRRKRRMWERIEADLERQGKISGRQYTLRVTGLDVARRKFEEAKQLLAKDLPHFGSWYGPMFESSTGSDRTVRAMGRDGGTLRTLPGFWRILQHHFNDGRLFADYWTDAEQWEDAPIDGKPIGPE